AERYLEFLKGYLIPKYAEFIGKVIQTEEGRQASFDTLGVVSENGIYGHSRFCNTDFDDKLACLNLSGV
ncbi:hypothetical protein ACLBTZ_33430, partial [Pseudomonas aeruginosa]